MADDARRPRDDLGAAPDSMSFFELLRRLEREGLRFGRRGGPGREPARLGQAPRLAAATRDVARLRERPGLPPEVEVEVIGLLGPEGPMPLHLTRWAFERASQRWFEGEDATADTAFMDFANLLQHRHIALYWRAWADQRAAVQAERPGGGRVGATLRALAGIGLPGEGRDGAVAGALLAHAPQVAWEPRGAERLADPVATLLGVPVRVREFVGAWVAVPEGLRTRLGRAHARLGAGAVAGARVFSRTDRVELRVGPLGLGLFQALAEGGAARQSLRRLVLALVGRDVEVDLRPVLRAAEVPAPRLGAVALGRTLWLAGREGRDRDDLRVAGLTAELAGGAA